MDDNSLAADAVSLNGSEATVMEGPVLCSRERLGMCGESDEEACSELYGKT